MTHLLLMMAFVVVMAILQENKSRRIVAYNAKITKGEYPKKDKGTYMVTAMLIMMLLAAFRSSKVGNDTEEYIRIFNMINSDPNYADASRYETGYIFLNKIVGKITTNPQAILIVSAFIYYPIFIWFLKKNTKNYSMTLLLFFFFMYGSSLTMIRQQIATAFVFISIDRIFNNHYIRAEIWILIATLFHASAIVLLVLPILAYIKFDMKFAVFIIVLCIISVSTNLLYKICEKIAPSYLHYFTSQYAGSGWLAITYQLLSNLVYFVIVYIANVKEKKLQIANAETKRLNNYKLWVAFGAFAGFILGYSINLIDRIMLYLTVQFLIFVPDALKKYDKNAEFLLKFSIVSVLILYSIVVLVFRPEWNSIYPYSFFWQD